MIVVLPDYLAGNIELAHKIHWLGLREHCEVLYLTLIDDYDNYLTKSRSMATMVAATSNDLLVVGSKLVNRRDWLTVLKDLIQPEDIILCQDEQSVRKGWFGAQSLSGFIHDNFPNRVVIVTGFYKPILDQIKHITHKSILFAGFLIIFGLFTALEVYLDRGLTGTLRMIMLIAVICIEYGAFYAWNNVFGN